VRARYAAHSVSVSEGGGGGEAAVHSLAYSMDGKWLASRCVGEECARIWDVRRLGKTARPAVVCAGVRSLDEYSNCAFSPDGKLLCVGTSVRPLRSKRKGEVFIQEFGMLKIFRVDGLDGDGDSVQTDGGSSSMRIDGVAPTRPILEMDVALGVSVVNVVWHAKLNQIFLGLSDGSVKICYDKQHSKKGALFCLAKGIKRVDELSLLLASRIPQNSSLSTTGAIKTPHALPLFRDEEERIKDNNRRKHKRDREEDDNRRTKKPQPPATGIKMGEGTSAKLNFQQFIVSSNSSKMLQSKNIAGRDPREALFKYSVGDSERKGKYGEEVKVLAEKTIEEEEEEEMKKRAS